MNWLGNRVLQVVRHSEPWLTGVGIEKYWITEDQKRNVQLSQKVMEKYSGKQFKQKYSYFQAQDTV